jgi:hypothetical protein
LTQEDESEQDWDTLEVVKGKLVKISKSERTVTIEEEGYTADETRWTTYQVCDDFDDSDFEDASDLIGHSVQAVLKDEEVESLEESGY